MTQICYWHIFAITVVFGQLKMASGFLQQLDAEFDIVCGRNNFSTFNQLLIKQSTVPTTRSLRFPIVWEILKLLS